MPESSKKSDKLSDAPTDESTEKVTRKSPTKRKTSKRKVNASSESISSTSISSNLSSLSVQSEPYAATIFLRLSDELLQDLHTVDGSIPVDMMMRHGWCSEKLAKQLIERVYGRQFEDTIVGYPTGYFMTKRFMLGDNRIETQTSIPMYKIILQSDSGPHYYPFSINSTCLVLLAEISAEAATLGKETSKGSEVRSLIITNLDVSWLKYMYLYIPGEYMNTYARVSNPKEKLISCVAYGGKSEDELLGKTSVERISQVCRGIRQALGDIPWAQHLIKLSKLEADLDNILIESGVYSPAKVSAKDSGLASERARVLAQNQAKLDAKKQTETGSAVTNAFECLVGAVAGVAGDAGSEEE